MNTEVKYIKKEHSIGHPKLDGNHGFLVYINIEPNQIHENLYCITDDLSIVRCSEVIPKITDKDKIIVATTNPLLIGCGVPKISDEDLIRLENNEGTIMVEHELVSFSSFGNTYPLRNVYLPKEDKNRCVKVTILNNKPEQPKNDLNKLVIILSAHQGLNANDVCRVIFTKPKSDDPNDGWHTVVNKLTGKSTVIDMMHENQLWKFFEPTNEISDVYQLAKEFAENASCYINLPLRSIKNIKEELDDAFKSGWEENPANDELLIYKQFILENNLETKFKNWLG